MVGEEIHAALFRSWKNRVKGRDWYDVIWFIRRKTPLNIIYLEKYLKKNNAMELIDYLDLEKLNLLLEEKIMKIDFDLLLNDIRPFIRDETILKDWNVNFFKYWFNKIIATPSEGPIDHT